MAATQRQSQFYRHLSLGFLALWLLISPSFAADYAIKGSTFYLLSDSGFASTETATVRLEASTYDAQTYGGVDILVYRVPKPLDFLKQQKDPHKLNLKGNYQGEGAVNALRYLWDQWYARSRLAWQRVFSAPARGVVTHIAPVLKTPPPTTTRYTAARQYQPLKGFELVDEFRYPLQSAKPEAPNARLEGSSSERGVTPGNVRVPLGKLKPGLYIVEGYMGSYRAATLLFVADTALFTKVSAEQMLAWTAHKQTGAAVADSELVWSDGNGSLKSGDSDKEGIAIFKKTSPEQSYVYGIDPQGGAMISESFYYPAEVNNSKLYISTDHPLYRPGDTVNIALVGREFTSAREHSRLKSETVQLMLRDPAGTELSRQEIKISADGATTHFTLPDNAVAGGYDLRLVYQNTPYAAPFRVAEYTKPHYDISIDLDKAALKTGEEVSGKVSMRYPDGRPVAGASVELVLRSQRVSMVNDEVQYQGLFPLKLRQDTLKLDASGNARFSLPAATDPSRYVLRVIGSQSGAYPVTASREVLIDSAASRYRLNPDTQFASVGETARFKIISDWPGSNKPASWSAQRLEDRSIQKGNVAGAELAIQFKQAGNYQIRLLDAAGKELGQTPFIVSGKGLNVAPGSISLLFDKENYQLGETASGMLTFPEDVSDALLTLELENVQEQATLAKGASWLKLAKISARQWQISLPIEKDYRPNMTFSVLYVKHGSHSFQNRGLAVIQPKIDVSIKADKKEYQPGDLVTLELSSSVAGKGASAQLSLGVVDEMVYLLQPEITPDIYDFFYHARRNAVRTSASLNFYGYDMAWSPRAAGSDEMRYSSRSQKMLVRPRRDNMDTAYWNGALKTDANGKLKIQFRMPDALSRWRITARAIDNDGIVGQKTHYINSNKAAYVQWAATRIFREGDTPSLQVAITQQAEKAQYQLVVRAGNATQKEQTLNLAKGTNYVAIEPGPLQNGQLIVELKQGGKLIDRLITDLSLRPTQDLQTISQSISLQDGKAEISLPVDAQNVRLQLLDSGDAAFRSVIDDLIAYPYGCVEQTASRLLPLAMAYQKLADAPAPMREALRQRIETARLRLLKMSDAGAVFSWWGDSTAADPLLSAYARLAEQTASRALGLSPRLSNSKSFQALYAKSVATMPPLHQALTLWMAAASGEATKTQLSGLVDQLVQLTKSPKQATGSVNIMNEPDSALGQQAALVLLSKLASQQKIALPDGIKAAAKAATTTLQQRPEPWLQALVAWSSGDKTNTPRLLAALSQNSPTLERSLALLWLQDEWKTAKASTLAPDGSWRKQTGSSGGIEWLLKGKAGEKLPLQIAKAPKELAATLKYESVVKTASTLGVSIHRQLYVLVPTADAGFSAKAVEWGSKLATDKLYVDEIVLDAKKTYRYGLLEAALPPGAVVEEQHWGLKIDNLSGQNQYEDEEGKEQSTLPVQAMQQKALGYAMPVPKLEGKTVMRQIVRFTQAGRFTLPPARYFRMYQPEETAQEEGATRVVEIR
ncbi:alpha-2-macroglobulin [Iodobacter sp.]|uniref:alpha-2-macroglobulin family protein n=1 Tax=Iodobacter sp. TaxID=1915058 RepID=UPI0025FC9B0F|nr:MG2 domain-containing protein [Iodobacter sp.]